MTSHTLSDPGRRTYRPEGWRRVIVYVLAGAMALAGVSIPFLYSAGMFADGPDRCCDSFGWSFAGTAFLVGLAVFIAYVVRRGRLITSPRGIEYHQVGYSISSSWDDVAGIGRVKMQNGTEMEGLILRKPSLEKRNWIAWLMARGVQEDGIPLELFSSNWERGQLGEDVRAYAQHLFRPGNAASTDAAHRRR